MTSPPLTESAMAPFPLRLRHLDAPLHHRPNTCSTWSKPKDYSQSHNVARPMQTGIETWSPDGLWDEVQRSPQRCSQAFRSSQKRTADLHIYKAGDPRRALSPDVFHAGFLPQAVAHANGVHVREPARPNMVFESRSDRIAGPRRQNRPALLADLPPRRIDHPPSARDHPPLSTRPSTVDPANHAAASPRSSTARPRERRALRVTTGVAAAWLARSTVDGQGSGGWSRADSGQGPTHKRFLSRRQPFADAGQAFEPHSLGVQRYLCNMCTRAHAATPPRTHTFAAATLSHACEPHAVGRYSSGAPGTPRFFHAPVAGGLKEQLRVSPHPISLQSTFPRARPHRSRAHPKLRATTSSQARPPTPVVRHAPGLRSAPCSPRPRFSDLPADPRPHVHVGAKGNFHGSAV
jgi:hypothetical protein